MFPWAMPSPGLPTSPPIRSRPSTLSIGPKTWTPSVTDSACWAVPPRTTPRPAWKATSLCRPTGFHPLRYPGQGKYLLNGRNPYNDWNGFIPFEELPYEMNPARGFVSSANQHTADAAYPHWLGWRFATEARGTIINRTLERLTGITHQDMIDLQLNSDNYRAQRWLDEMLSATRTYLREQQPEMPEAASLPAQPTGRVESHQRGGQHGSPGIQHLDPGGPPCPVETPYRWVPGRCPYPRARPYHNPGNPVRPVASRGVHRTDGGTSERAAAAGPAATWPPSTPW